MEAVSQRAATPPGGLGLCDHYETDTQPEECTDCVCEDCGDWRPSREISQCGGLCAKCLDKSLDEASA